MKFSFNIKRFVSKLLLHTLLLVVNGQPATACPTERATAISIGLVNSLATAIASNEAFLAIPTDTLSSVHSFAILIALVSRSSTLFEMVSVRGTPYFFKAH
ncbi:MAG: hypothetical protein V4714_21885 [Bacteroidota bacterium]